MLDHPETSKKFWSHVNKLGPVADRFPEAGRCWLWVGATTRGYGSFRGGNGGRHGYAHRLSWQFAKGEIAPKVMIDHWACSNRNCVNPDHLREASNRVNSQNRWASDYENTQSGYRGVSFHTPSGKWRARGTRPDGREAFLGLHDTPEEASLAASEWRADNYEGSIMDRLDEGGYADNSEPSRII